MPKDKNKNGPSAPFAPPAGYDAAAVRPTGKALLLFKHGKYGAEDFAIGEWSNYHNCYTWNRGTELDRGVIVLRWWPLPSHNEVAERTAGGAK